MLRKIMIYLIFVMFGFFSINPVINNNKNEIYCNHHEHVEKRLNQVVTYSECEHIDEDLNGKCDICADCLHLNTTYYQQSTTHEAYCYDCFNIFLVEEHSISYVIEDNYWHIKTCNVCGLNEYEQHVYDVEGCSDYECNICGYLRDNPHSLGSTFTKLDENDDKYHTHHLEVCSVCGTSSIVREHFLSTMYDDYYHYSYCYSCGYSSEKISHNIQYFYYDDSSHYKKCKDCGFTTYYGLGNSFNVFEDHIYTNEQDQTCNDCGYIRPIDGIPVISFSTNNIKMNSYGCEQYSLDSKLPEYTLKISNNSSERIELDFSLNSTFFFEVKYETNVLDPNSTIDIKICAIPSILNWGDGNYVANLRIGTFSYLTEYERYVDSSYIRVELPIKHDTSYSCVLNESDDGIYDEDYELYHTLSCSCGYYNNYTESHKDLDENGSCDQCLFIMPIGGEKCYHSKKIVKYDDTYHWEECENCGDIVVEKTTHNIYDYSYVKDSKEHWKGCENCGYRVIGTTEEHTIADGTCYCSTCWYTEHDYSIYEDNKEGMHNIKCSICGETSNVDYHSWDEGTVFKEATCEENGVIKYTCLECGNCAYSTINKLGHSYNSVVTPPTCEEDGYTTHTCETCGDSYVDTYVEALGHNYKEIEHKDSTCEEDGYTKYECENDSTHTYQNEYDSLGHSYNSVVTPPTCEEDGYTTHTCETCGDSYVDTYVDALGHNYKEIEHKDSTCEEDGYTKYECETCGDKYKIIYQALGHVFTNSCDTSCNVSGCDYSREITHNYFPSNNDTSHYDECETCGNKINIKDHVYSDDNDTSCNDSKCDYERVVSSETINIVLTVEELQQFLIVLLVAFGGFGLLIMFISGKIFRDRFY